MDLITLLEAAFLGVVEGVTEYMPVSSTGHLILLDDLLGFLGPPGKVFEIVIQLGAMLAVFCVYQQRLFGVLVDLPTDRGAQRFTSNVLSPSCRRRSSASPPIRHQAYAVLALGRGGGADRRRHRDHGDRAHGPSGPRCRDRGVQRAPSLGIGVLQCLAMIPGVSRSGATIMGALLLGVERRTAAEFSFFLAIPTMFAATVYDLYKNRAVLSVDNSLVIAVGFVLAFISALFVVRSFIGFVGRHGFVPFAIYRIIFGALMLGILLAR